MLRDPTTVANLAARWKAIDCAAVGDGNKVTTWTDSIAAIAPTQASAPNKPTYRASVAALGGKPGVEFDRFFTMSLKTPSTAALLKNVAGFTAFVAYSLPATDPNGYIAAGSLCAFGIGTGTGADFRSEYRLIAAGHPGFQLGRVDGTGGMPYQPGTATVVLGGGYVGTVMADWSTARLSDWLSGTVDVNNVAFGTTGLTGNTDARSVTIGGEHDGTSLLGPWHGSIAEILIYERALTAPERATVHSYLQEEYGVAVSDFVPQIQSSMQSRARRRNRTRR